MSSAKSALACFMRSPRPVFEYCSIYYGYGCRRPWHRPHRFIDYLSPRNLRPDRPPSPSLISLVCLFGPRRWHPMIVSDHGSSSHLSGGSAWFVLAEHSRPVTVVAYRFVLLARFVVGRFHRNASSGLRDGCSLDLLFCGALLFLSFKWPRIE